MKAFRRFTFPMHQCNGFEDWRPDLQKLSSAMALLRHPLRQRSVGGIRRQVEILATGVAVDDARATENSDQFGGFILPSGFPRDGANSWKRIAAC